MMNVRHIGSFSATYHSLHKVWLFERFGVGADVSRVHTFDEPFLEDRQNTVTRILNSRVSVTSKSRLIVGSHSYLSLKQNRDLVALQQRRPEQLSPREH